MTSDDAGDTAGAGAKAAGPEGATLLVVAGYLVVAATSWYLLREFALLLRPLFLAVFLCYIIVPVHLYLKQRIPLALSMMVLVGVPVGLLYLLALMVHASVVEFEDEMPRLIERVESMTLGTRDFADRNLPWLFDTELDVAKGREQRTKWLRDMTATAVNIAADTLVEALVVGVYLLFLLLEAGRFQGRVRYAFDSEQAQHILTVFGNVNRAIASYVRLKAIASLYLAVSVTVVLWICGVKFALLWGVLTFMCNFIPYLGSIIAVSTPLVFAFVWLEPGWRPIATAVGVITIHLVMTYLVEPRMVGRGVGLSPLVILIALTFWGQCWGFIGMFLAIPLTVMLKIILQNMAFTRSIANMLGDT
jgi:AI-2 transport protein TqsA